MEGGEGELKHKAITMMMKDKVMMKKEAPAEEDDVDIDDEDDKKKRVVGGGGGGGKKGSNSGTGGGGGGGGRGSTAMRNCQAERCTADLSEAKQYHRRHKVCEHHAKAQVAVVAGIRQRFCQQCSRFHELLEFDESKRSCRRRLAGHNERRRKNSSADSQTDQGSSSRKGMKEIVQCGQVDDKGRIQVSIQQENSSYNKHFQIR